MSISTNAFSIFLLTCIPLSSCIEVDEDFGDKLAETGKSVEETGKSIEAAAEDLSKALEGIDLTGMKQVLSKNADLEEELMALRKAMVGLMEGSGTVVLKDRRIRLEVPAHAGSFRIDAWIDDEKNAFLQEVRLEHVPSKLTRSTTYRSILQKFKGQYVNDGVINLVAKETSDLVLRVLENNSAICPGGDIPIDLKPQFLTGGDHIIKVRVTPLAAVRRIGKPMRWSFRGRLASIAANGDEDQLKLFDWDSDAYPLTEYPLGEPLPTKELFLMVTTTDQ